MAEKPGLLIVGGIVVAGLALGGGGGGGEGAPIGEKTTIGCNTKLNNENISEGGSVRLIGAKGAAAVVRNVDGHLKTSGAKAARITISDIDESGAPFDFVEFDAERNDC